MSSSPDYVVSGTSPLSDFDTDIENLVIEYIFDEWSFTDPSLLAKPDEMHGGNQGSNSQNIEFRSGFDRGRPAFQVLCIQTDTEVMAADVSMRSWNFKTRLEITVISNIMEDIDNVRPELGQMEREVQRILNQYRQGDIEGIDTMQFTGQSRIYDDIIVGTGAQQVRGSRGSRTSTASNWAQSRWKSKLYAEVTYWKDDISS